MMKVKKVPQRKCLGCNEMKDKKALLRVVRSPEGEVSLDLTGKKNGRGAYVCPDKECITKAVKEKRLERALERRACDQSLIHDIVAPASQAYGDGRTTCVRGYERENCCRNTHGESGCYSPWYGRGACGLVVAYLAGTGLSCILEQF